MGIDESGLASDSENQTGIRNEWSSKRVFTGTGVLRSLTRVLRLHSEPDHYVRLVRHGLFNVRMSSLPGGAGGTDTDYSHRTWTHQVDSPVAQKRMPEKQKSPLILTTAGALAAAASKTCFNILRSKSTQTHPNNGSVYPADSSLPSRF